MKVQIQPILPNETTLQPSLSLSLSRLLSAAIAASNIELLSGFGFLFYCPLFSNRSKETGISSLGSVEVSPQPIGGHKSMESHNQASERPILCINNCGFFGRAATMNMCSKCYKDMLLKQEHAKLAASSVENIVNGSSSSNGEGAVSAVAMDVQVETVGVKSVSAELSGGDSSSSNTLEVKVKAGPSRCATCQKRVGLTGFSCKCGNLFCAMHRYSDKHDCPFDYRTAGQDAIAKANPLIKAEKLDKI